MMVTNSNDNWLLHIFEHLSVSTEWRKCSKQIELLCKDFIDKKISDEPHLHCLLFLLGRHFAETYFPNVQLSYYYLKEPFLSGQQLKELQSRLLKELREFVAAQIERCDAVNTYKNHLEIFTKQLLPNSHSNKSIIKAKSKRDVNDAVAMIMSLYPKHLHKLKALKGCELSGSLREFVWMHTLQSDKNKEKENKFCDESSTETLDKKNANNNIKELIQRILQMAARNMEPLGYKMDKNEFEKIETMLNKFYNVYERYSYRLSVISIHLFDSLQLSHFDESVLFHLIDGRMCDSNQCKANALETISALKKEDNDLYFLLFACFKNVSRNIQLLESQKKINKNEAIPITLKEMFYEFYFHSFVGYLGKDTLCFIWDQLFLCNDWRKLQTITLQMLIHSDLKHKIKENEVCDAINLFNLIKAYLRNLSVDDLKNKIKKY